MLELWRASEGAPAHSRMGCACQAAQTLAATVEDLGTLWTFDDVRDERTKYCKRKSFCSV
jgi:hypothetical protein